MPSEAKSETNENVEVKLKRDLGLLEITMIGLGPTLGSTIFLLVGFGLQITGTGLVLVFILNFVVIIFTAMAYSELSSAFPDTGGGYLWVKEGLPQPFGFLAGWMSWFGHCIVTSFYVLGFGKGLLWILTARGMIPADFDGDLLVKALAVAVCFVFIWINYKGTKETGRSGIYITVVLLTIIITFIVAGALYIFNGLGEGNVGDVVSNPTPGGIGAVVVAMGFTFIIFEGFEIISQCGEECKNPLKNVPRATWLCIIISTLIFIMVAIVCIGVVDLVPMADGHFNVVNSGVSGGAPILGEDVVARAAGVSMPGDFGVILIGVGVILGTLAAVNSTLFSSSRVSFAMGRDGALPRSFGVLSKKTHTPHIAIFMSGIIIIAMTIFLPIEEIAASTAIMFLLLFMFVNLSAITLRYKRPDIQRHYMMPLFPYVPIIGVITLMILTFAVWIDYPLAVIIALVWIEIGVLAYYLYGGKDKIEELRPADIHEAKKSKTAKEKKYRILVPVVDERQKTLVWFASLVARVEDGELRLLKVIETPRVVPVDSLTYKELSPHIKVVDKLKKIPDRWHIRADGEVLVSHMAADAILDTITEEYVNLLILGWEGEAKEDRIFGVNVDKLVQNAECDVVVFKSLGMKKDLKRILVVSTPEWHASYATGYAVLLAKQDYASVTIFSACQNEEEKAKEDEYAERLCQICHTHEVEFEKEIEVVKSVEDAIVAKAQDYDLVVFGAAAEWDSKHFTFGNLQDRLARRIEKPILMVRKIRPKDDFKQGQE